MDDPWRLIAKDVEDVSAAKKRNNGHEDGGCGGFYHEKKEAVSWAVQRFISASSFGWSRTLTPFVPSLLPPRISAYVFLHLVLTGWTKEDRRRGGREI